MCSCRTYVPMIACLVVPGFELRVALRERPRLQLAPAALAPEPGAEALLGPVTAVAGNAAGGGAGNVPVAPARRSRSRGRRAGLGGNRPRARGRRFLGRLTVAGLRVLRDARGRAALRRARGGAEAGAAGGGGRLGCAGGCGDAEVHRAGRGERRALRAGAGR